MGFSWFCLHVLLYQIAAFVLLEQYKIVFFEIFWNMPKKYDIGEMVTFKCNLESMWKATVLAKLWVLCSQLPELTEVNREYNS